MIVNQTNKTRKTDKINQINKINKINKRGMGVGQVFVFIIAGITFALIMIFGYQSITQFTKSGEDVEFVQFKTSLETSVKKIYTEFGSVRIERYSLPQKYEQICFVDLDSEYDPDLCKKDQIACSVWKTAKEEGGYNAVDENVFIQPIAPVPLKVYHISIDNEGKNFLCLPIVKGAFSLYLEGRGDLTRISTTN
ncbi:hypothetical protein COY27_03645 [Candidatus Woesearchaeota archaeon CG_4_10_14_0_2_um_filter_33_13]|nr:MAG: hypothetical protein COY27_03645 [Candidatus Woesearchaeota archaeon CG_4_10_14_0_2_um_filter_33_13]